MQCSDVKVWCSMVQYGADCVSEEDMLFKEHLGCEKSCQALTPEHSLCLYFVVRLEKECNKAFHRGHDGPFCHPASVAGDERECRGQR